MTHDRPHRPALGAEAAAEALAAEAAAGRLDGDAVAGVLDALGDRAARRGRPLRPGGLSEREVEVGPPRRRGLLEPGDRGAPGHLAAHGRAPRPARLREARRLESRRRGVVRPRARPPVHRPLTVAARTAAEDGQTYRCRPRARRPRVPVVHHPPPEAHHAPPHPLRPPVHRRPPGVRRGRRPRRCPRPHAPRLQRLPALVRAADGAPAVVPAHRRAQPARPRRLREADRRLRPRGVRRGRRGAARRARHRPRRRPRALGGQLRRPVRRRRGPGAHARPRPRRCLPLDAPTSTASTASSRRPGLSATRWTPGSCATSSRAPSPARCRRGSSRRSSPRSRKLPAAVWSAFLGDMLAAEIPTERGPITAPTLILWGDRDTYARRADQDALVAAIPEVELVVYRARAMCRTGRSPPVLPPTWSTSPTGSPATGGSPGSPEPEATRAGCRSRAGTRPPTPIWVGAPSPVWVSRRGVRSRPERRRPPPLGAAAGPHLDPGPPVGGQPSVRGSPAPG